MFAAGLPGPAVLQFALSLAYGQNGMKGLIRSRWRNIAYATRYGKGCTLSEAIGLDAKSMNDYIEALNHCLNEEAKASKVKKR